MAKSHNQKAKILFLEQMLRDTGEEHIVTMQQILAKLMEYGIPAERKSIYDDIEALRSFGMDIRFRRGRPGGYYLFKEQIPSERSEKTVLPEEKSQEYKFEKPMSQSKKKQMKLVCAPETEKQIQSFFGTDAKYKQKESGDILVTTYYMNDPQFFGWLTSMGIRVRIFKPKKLVQAYRDYLKMLIKEYKQSD